MSGRTEKVSDPLPDPSRVHSTLDHVLSVHPPDRWRRATLAAARTARRPVSADEWPAILDELDALFARVLPFDF